MIVLLDIFSDIIVLYMLFGLNVPSTHLDIYSNELYLK